MKKISQNFIWMSAANIVSSAFNALIFILLARKLKAEAFGSFSYAQTVMFYLFNFIDLGLSTYGIREISRNKDNAKVYIYNIISLRFVLAAILYIVSSAVLIFVNQPLQFKLLMQLMLLMLFPAALATEWVFQGLEKMQMVFVSFLTTTTLQFLLLLIFVKTPPDLLAAPLVIFLASLPIIIVFLNILKFKFRISNLNLPDIAGYLKSALVIWSISLFVQVYNALDILILGLFRSAQFVGYYSVARRILAGIMLFTIFLANAALPRLSANFRNDFKGFSDTTKDFLKLMAILGVILFVFFVLFSEKIISLTVGNSYLPASLSFKILILGAILVLFNLPFSTGLIAAGLEKDVLRQAVASACLSVGLNFLLIPKLGMEGAAISFFYAEALGLIWILWVHYKKLKLKAVA